MQLFKCFLVVLVSIHVLFPLRPSHASTCSKILDSPLAIDKTVPAYPRELDAKQTFDALVQWVHDDVIVKRGAPGLVVGISGTDSILAFLACAKAFEKAGRPDRVVGIHFGDPLPAMSEVMGTESRAQFWFQLEVIPWLKKNAPGAQILVDSSIDSRRDGLRWGALMDWSVIKNPLTGAMRPPKEQFWVVGTRNATEEALFNYSNASSAASVQILSHLWKSEVLQISKYLEVPEKAIQRSCEVDCVCGRMQLPAYNIPEVDALLMVRQGTLSENYIKENIPSELRDDLTKFIESQIRSSNFKTQIPYLPERSVIHLKQVVDPALVASIKDSMTKRDGDLKPFSRLVPEIIAKSQSNIASDLVTTPSSNRERWLAEALTLFGTPGLRLSQKRQMLKNIFSLSDTNALDAFEVSDLSRCNARIGSYGFSFPQWRFLTQKYGDQQLTLAERFGMSTLARTNDIRDASLNATDPARDELGRGFIWQDGEWYVEYRRAYIVVSNLSKSNPAILVIRNNSHYFGRDRLVNPVYFSFSHRSPTELQSLTVSELETSTRYTRWQDLLQSNLEFSSEQKLKQVTRLLDYLDRFNLRMSQWLQNPDPKGGAEALLSFLDHKLSTQTANNTPAFYLGLIEKDSPPWAVKSAAPLTADTVARFRTSMRLDQVVQGLSEKNRFIMTTGASGDYP